MDGRETMAANVRRNLLTGIVTLIPILVTVFILSFFLNLLSDIGRPSWSSLPMH
jgi:uncharacterized membrane protein